MVEKAGMKELDLGVTGRMVAENVRLTREATGLSYAALSSELEALGHRIPVLGLRRIEAKARRVDVDDLMALAAVFGVPPIQLLFNAAMEPEEERQGTGLPAEVNFHEATAWARGDTFLDLQDREQYWRRRILSLESELARHREREANAQEEAAGSPEDTLLRMVASSAMHRVTVLERSLKDAVKRQEALQLMLESR